MRIDSPFTLLLLTILWALTLKVTAEYATVTKPSGENITLITNLDDNQICYLHMYGIRINGRRPLHPYTHGYKASSTSPALKLVTTLDSNVTLASAEEFVNATKSSDHSPEYKETINYCDIAQALIDQYKARNNNFRQITPFALRGL